MREPTDISSHLDHVEQSRRNWRPDTHVTPLQLSADAEPEHFAVCLAGTGRQPQAQGLAHGLLLTDSLSLGTLEETGRAGSVAAGQLLP